MPKAVIVGGTGQIGLAAAHRLSGEGWDVTVASRHAMPLPDGCGHFEADARDAETLKRAVGSNTDLLLSCVAFDAADAECLAEAGRAAGHIVAISSASVYKDGKGRTLDEASECGFPTFSVPLTEQSPTVAAGPETYSTRKIAMEQTLCATASCPVTILRPCAVHGPHSKHAREWWFIKRLLDGRTAIPLAYRGQSRFQTTSVAAIVDAALSAVAGHLPAVTNVSDADCPSVAEIGRAIMDVMGARAELVGLPDAPSYPPALGATPWSIPRPMVCSAAAAAKQSYDQSAEPAIKWLASEVTNENWTETLPQLATYVSFDYELDEQALGMPDAETLAA